MIENNREAILLGMGVFARIASLEGR